VCGNGRAELPFECRLGSGDQAAPGIGQHGSERTVRQRLDAAQRYFDARHAGAVVFAARRDDMQTVRA